MSNQDEDLRERQGLVIFELQQQIVYLRAQITYLQNETASLDDELMQCKETVRDLEGE